MCKKNYQFFQILSCVVVNQSIVQGFGTILVYPQHRSSLSVSKLWWRENYTLLYMLMLMLMITNPSTLTLILMVSQYRVSDVNTTLEITLNYIFFFNYYLSSLSMYWCLCECSCFIKLMFLQCNVCFFSLVIYSLCPAIDDPFENV